MRAHLILYVCEQMVSCEFYSRLLNQDPRLDVPGMTEFVINENCILGLMPNSSIQRLLGINSVVEREIARAELYLHVECPETWYERALQAGARPLSPAQLRDWGDRVAYCSDPDGHILGFACCQGAT
ncbi:hypothetical protein JST97_37850 [bacterium]|nr:hypothetical protein [bacterium]